MARQAPTTTQIALLGGETLLGRELQEVLQSREPEVSVKTYSAGGEGNFGEQEGEPVYLEPLNAQEVSSSLAVIVAGTPEGADKAYQLAKETAGKVKLIDCTGYLESRSEAKIVAPLMEEPKQSNWLLVIAHPVASALALVLKRITSYRRIARAVVNVFEPASERGKRGISELHQQTTSLLAFKSLDKQVFDAQLSFNLLSQYGEEAPVQLSTVEQRIERHLSALLKGFANGEPIPAPSLRLIQAPVFHGYSISLWIEFDPAGGAARSVNPQALGEALASAQIDVRSAGEEPPTGVGVASQSGLMAGDIRVDRNNAGAAWVWVVLDNLRVTADAAADIIRSLGTNS